MAYSFIEWQDQWVRMHDGALAIILIVATEKTASCSGQLKELLMAWKHQSISGPPGLIDFDLSPYIICKELQRQCLQILEEVMNVFRDNECPVTGDWLQSHANDTGIVFHTPDPDFIEGELTKFLTFLRKMSGNRVD